tara:strand:- start:4327 stop:4821 length:495 start_codon:yes stop_codon:yes gene_type:complete
MSLNSENQLKFKEGATTEPLTITKAGFEELPFGNKFVVHIKPLITGETYFLPSPGLEKKLKEENVDISDQITIEKVAKSEQYPYGYFSVSVVQKGGVANSPVGAGFAQKDAKHESVENFEKQFDSKDDKMALHELTIRVEKLESIVAALSGKEVEKSDDEAIPF